jgi:radical SAM superfamily enzyme YgiQ (UPF0313 family)
MFAHFLLHGEPLGLEYIAAGVEAQHQVKILDMVIDKKLFKVLKNFQPDIVGCTVCTSTVNTGMQVFTQIKAYNPEILTVVGGPHPTVQPQDLFDQNVDLIVVGEGVDTFEEICDRHQARMDFETIDGIYYKNEGRMVPTTPRDFPNLDRMPFPDRSLTAHYRHKYKLLAADDQSLAFIRGSAGCSYTCTFCTITSTLKGKVYKRDPQSIVRELATIGEKAVFFVDDEFLLDPDRTVHLAHMIGKAGIRKNFGFFSRSDTIVKRPDTIEAWAKVGLKYVMVGMESNRDEDLRQFKKGISISTNEEALRILKKNAVWARVNYIVQPDDDFNDLKCLEEYVRSLGVELPFYSILTPLPGTNFYEETKTEFITCNYDLWDLTHTVLPTKLPLKDFYKGYRRLIIRSVSARDKIKLLRQLDTKTKTRLIINWLRMVYRMQGMAKYYNPN